MTDPHKRQAFRICAAIFIFYCNLTAVFAATVTVPQRNSRALAPVLRTFLENAAGLLERLLDSRGGQPVYKPIKLILSSDMYPEIKLVVSKTARTDTVMINLGILQYLENDDELAFILDRILSRRESAVDNHVKNLSSSKAEKETFLSMLSRSIENESEYLTLTDTLLALGYNPYLALQFLERLQNAPLKAFARREDVTSTRLDSRIASGAMALARLRRLLGQRLPAETDSAKHEFMTPSLMDYVRSDELFQQGRQAFDHFWSHLPQDATDELFQSVLHRRDHPHTENTAKIEKKHRVNFESIFDPLWRQSLSLMDATRLGAKDLLGLERNAILALDDGLEEARHRLLGENYLPRNYEEFISAVSILPSSYHPFSSGHLAFLLDEIKTIQNKIRRTQANADLAAGDRDRHVRVLESDIVEIQQQVDALLDFVEEGHRSKCLTLTQAQAREVEIPFVGIVERTRRNAAWDLHLRRNAAPALIEGLETDQIFGMLIDSYNELSEDVRAQYDEKALAAFFDHAADRLRKNPRQLLEHAFEGITKWSALINLARSDHSQYLNRLRNLIRTYFELSELSLQAVDILLLVSSSDDPTPAILMETERYHRPYFSKGEAREILLGQTADEPTLFDDILHRLQASALAKMNKPLSLEQFLHVIDEFYWRRTRTLWEIAQRTPGTSEIPFLRAMIQKFLGFKTKARGFSEEHLLAIIAAIFPNLVDLAPDLVWEKLVDINRNQQLQRKTRGIFPLISLRRTLFPALSAEEFFAKVRAIDSLVSVHAGRVSMGETMIGYSGGEIDPIKEVLSYVRWTRRHQPLLPERMAEYLGAFAAFSMHDPNSPLNKLQDEYDVESALVLRNQIAIHDQNHAGLSPIERGGAVGQALIIDFAKALDDADNAFLLGLNTDTILSQLPENLGSRVEYLFGLLQGLSSRHDCSLRRTVMESLEEELQRPEVRREFALSPMADYIRQSLLEKRTSPQLDEVFAAFWERTNDHSPERESLRSEDLVRHLNYDEYRLRLARWQLERQFRLSDLAAEVRRNHHDFSEAHSIRGIVQEIAAHMDRQFPKPSVLKNNILDEVENLLITNGEETAFLDAKKLNTKNWFESRKLALLDMPQILGSLIKDPMDRLQLLKYLIGATDVIPSFINADPSNSLNRQQVEKLREFRRHFFEADPMVRLYTLQPLLAASSGGILSNDQSREEGLRILLGSQASHPLYRALFEAYCQSLPASEVSILWGHLFATFASRPVNQRSAGVSLREILEAMGPFGIKAGQFLRTSGLLPKELRSQLDHFFSQASPPERMTIYTKLRAAFGEQLAGVHSVRQLIGSGSLNYVVLAEIWTPKEPGEAFGKTRQVVIRVLRENAQGQIANENEIWQRAITLLKNHRNDPTILRMAAVVEEARNHAMGTLQPGGPELDLAQERSFYADMSRVYRHASDPDTGFRIEVASPDALLQQQVSPQLSHQVSVYEFVPHTPLAQINPPSLRHALARQIVSAELRALFDRGVFDPDGHPGNWLIDLPGRRLVRIDYAQMRRLSWEQTAALRSIFAALLSPALDSTRPPLKTHVAAPALAHELALHFKTMFDHEAPKDLESLLLGIIQSPDFPSAREPHERVFFIRDQLERHLAQSGSTLRLRDEFRSALSSLARIAIFQEDAEPGMMSAAVARELDLTTWNVLRQQAEGASSFYLRRAQGWVIQGTRSCATYLENNPR